jgi:uncharacterized tellurite resistance protein B-like protein
MITKDKLYDAFGELIYAVAKADGIVQNEELTALEDILKKHTWARDVRWSCDYELKNNTDIEESYSKAMDTFQQYGPTPEYLHLIEIIEAIAQASAGIDASEKKVIDGFQIDLKERFIRDLEKGNLRINEISE